MSFESTTTTTNNERTANKVGHFAGLGPQWHIVERADRDAVLRNLVESFRPRGVPSREDFLLFPVSNRIVSNLKKEQAVVQGLWLTDGVGSESSLSEGTVTKTFFFLFFFLSAQ